MVKQKGPNIRKLFGGLQKQMVQHLRTARENVPHPTSQGEAAEAGWTSLLSKYLPVRYQVRKAFVLDSWGRLSEQIDLVIFDRQYSPFLLDYQGACYVPAESVYAVMEIKPRLNKATVKYAGKKISSVRRLLRTSGPIPHAGGIFEPRPQFNILGGLLTEDTDWSNAFGSNFESAIQSAPPVEQLDLGCVLSSGGFCVSYETSTIKIETARRQDALVFFILKLLQLLQALGTVPAMDVREYARSLPIKERELTLSKPVGGRRTGNR